jgi:hypothetical protein
MSDLLKLAERCEAATGHDRELDVELAVVAGLIRDPEFERGYFYGAGNNCDYVLERGDYDHGNNAPELPYYTASLDAAMTLVPEGLHVTHAGEARFMTRSPAFAVTVEEWGSEQADDGSEIATRPLVRHGVAATFPLALCAAALKARASMSHGEKQ